MARPPESDYYLREFRWYRRSRLWVVPATGAGVALIAAAVTLVLDNLVVSRGAPFPAFSGAAETARSMLTLIATSIATLTALVLTIVAVVIQLATQALSPRAVRTFLQDAHSHLTLGTFVATFTYSLVVLDQFHTIIDSDTGQVTSTSITVAFVLAILSLGMFISYVDHIVHQARVTSIIDQIGNETRRVIREKYDVAGVSTVEAEVPARTPDDIVRSGRHGVVLEIDVRGLVEEAARLDVSVVMVPAVGDFIPTNGRVFAVYGDRASEARGLLSKVTIDAERSIPQDVPFGFRLLIDIAERSLSPGVNDPTTATQVVDQLHDLLLMLGRCRLGDGWHADRDGTPRLHVAEPGWDLYVALAFEEIRQYGAGSLQVVRRLRAVIRDLCADLPEDRHAPLERQIGLLDACIERTFETELEKRAARSADPQGIGSGGGFGADETSASSRAG
jgi:uncharacterized membrane protein